MLRTCKICGATSEEKAFYARVNSRCADCHKAKVRENRAAKSDYYRQYDATRFQQDPRVKERHKKYRATEAGVSSTRLARKKWEHQNPIKKAAHIILNNAVRDGRIIKPSSCQSCGAKCRIHGHHEDYADPLSVKWLCQTCHLKEHKGQWEESWPTRK